MNSYSYRNSYLQCDSMKAAGVIGPHSASLRGAPWCRTWASQSCMKMRLAISRTIQSTPDASPLPVNALQLSIRQWRFSTASSCSSARISSAVSAPSMSCLLAKMSRDAPASL